MTRQLSREPVHLVEEPSAIDEALRVHDSRLTWVFDGV